MLELNDLPRDILCDLIARYGANLIDDSRWCEALLNDHCGEHRREIAVLMCGLKARVPSDLISTSDSVPPEILYDRLALRLCDDFAMKKRAAKWAVQTWALALGIVPEVEPAGSVSAADSLLVAAATGVMPQQRLREAIAEALKADVLTPESADKLRELRQRLDIPNGVASFIFRELQMEKMAKESEHSASVSRRSRSTRSNVVEVDQYVPPAFRCDACYEWCLVENGCTYIDQYGDEVKYCESCYDTFGDEDR